MRKKTCLAGDGSGSDTETTVVPVPHQHGQMTHTHGGIVVRAAGCAMRARPLSSFSRSRCGFAGQATWHWRRCYGGYGALQHCACSVEAVAAALHCCTSFSSTADGVGQRLDVSPAACANRMARECPTTSETETTTPTVCCGAPRPRSVQCAPIRARHDMFTFPPGSARRLPFHVSGSLPHCR
jgi:hypothetical protein